MRRPTPWIIVTTMILAVLTGCSTTVSTTGADPSDTTTASPSASPTATATADTDARPLGEIGPGACWLGDERPRGGIKTGFATKTGPADAAAWLRTREGQGPAKRLDRWLDSHKKYYLVKKVVPKWDKLSPVNRTTLYIEQLTAVQLPNPLRAQNTSCKPAANADVTAYVTKWEAQTFPAGEWVFVLPDGEKDALPVFKAVSGSPLLPLGS